MNPECDLKALWAAGKERGLVLKSAVDLLKEKGWGTWGTNTIKSAVDGNGGELREIVLRKVLKEYLGLTDSVKDGRSESAQPRVAKMAVVADDLTHEQWKRKAIQLEERLSQIQAICGAPVNSAASDPAYRLAREVLRRSKSAAQPDAAGLDSKDA